MTPTIRIRITGALAALLASPVVRADDGAAITTSGWLSMLLVVGIVGVLYGVHRKLG